MGGRTVYTSFFLGIGGISSGNPSYVLLGVGLIVLGIAVLVSIVKRY